MLPATLKGFERKTNVPFDGYAYLNIVPNPEKSIEGMLIRISEEEVSMFDIREEGYARVDVTVQLQEPCDGRAIAFIAPDIDYPNLQVPRSYLNTCLVGVPADRRDAWVTETNIPYGIFEDSEKPVYEFVATD